MSMADPCKQEGPIAALKSESESLLAALLRIETNQQEFVRLLREISSQGEQIKTLFQRTDKNEESITILFTRVRDMELAPGKQASQFQIYGVAAVISCVVGYVFKKIGG